MIKEVFQLHAGNILNNPDINEKIKSGLALGDYTGLVKNEIYSSDELTRIMEHHQALENSIQMNLTALKNWIPKTPARSDNWKYDENKSELLKRAVSPREWVFHILDSCLVDVEISAMEVSSVLLLSADNQPLEFYCDFAGHICDEAKHAQMIVNILEDFADFPKSWTYSNRVWNKVSAGKDILERLMIENVLEEGSAADRTVGLIEWLKQNSFNEVAMLFQQINTDEIRHVQIGNKWAMRFLDNDEDKYLQTFEDLCKRINPNASKIESIQTRLASGFSKKFIKKFF